MATYRQLSHFSSQIHYAGIPFLLYTRHRPGSDELEIGATDGIDKIYCTKVDFGRLKEFLGVSTDVQMQKQLAEVFSRKSLLLTEPTPGKLRLQVERTNQGKPLYLKDESKHAKPTIARLLFSSMEKVAEVRQELELTKSQAESESGTGKWQIGMPKDAGNLSSKSKKDLSDRNVVNPHSRKRAKATGVNYDDDSD